jgi:transcriptional regulator with XRE-family HTH domain
MFYAKDMTHFQRLFVQNLRFLRNKKGLSQVKFSELLAISPNYLNAVENGKNFPSPEVLQRMVDFLTIMPYQLFMEYPALTKPVKYDERSILIQELSYLKQKFNAEIENTLQKYEETLSQE